MKRFYCALRGVWYSLMSGWPITGIEASGHIHDPSYYERRSETTVWLIDRCVYCGEYVEMGWVHDESAILAGRKELL